MPIPYSTNILQPKGQLEIEETKPGFYRTMYIPPVEVLPDPNSKPEDFKKLIVDINQKENVLTIYPFQVGGFFSMKNKYSKLFVISFDMEWYADNFLPPDEDKIQTLLSYVLPEAFIDNYNFGFGFRKNYKPILSMLEGFDISKLHITIKGTTKFDLQKKEASIKKSDFEKMSKAINKITQRFQKASFKLKRDTVSDIFSQLLTNATLDNTNDTIASELAKTIGNSTRFMYNGATKKEQSEAIEVLRQNSKKIISEQHGEFLKLRNEIELVSLEGLISKFEAMLDKKLSETQWQRLFDENPFILTMAFGTPVINVHSQASVGGTKLAGSGNKIADYLVKNTITNNVAIVEIKTPNTKLINIKEYRGGVFAPSNEVTGAINQILDQIHHFQTSINTLKAESREYNLESYSVQAILIAGRSVDGLDERKSFELFRGNSKNVQVVTFDELLMKLKNLYSFLNSTSKPATKITTHESLHSGDELPF